ncbi:hypothetical protein ES689_03440 [Frigoribacterium sp. ACAM 257]|uniref:hypothetical protein n=1 Tax=Frigoribacterium sp. ACAM 257 TaxID=2508998 RepID=UPI0011B9FB7E|nr:hypothetical protein [Frigoribacterium sp. ACAM 257]TWX40515.1 hypothetical protein ES689_03440 [Frigoribacterium sp. ACAM 257]
MTLTAVLAATPTPLYPADPGVGSPVPLWLGVAFGVLVVVASFVVLLPSVRHALDRVAARRPRRFRR